MDSYDEFARRARIMTEVHALPADDNNEKEKAEVQSNDDNELKKKVKDAKKKSLKRL